MAFAPHPAKHDLRHGDRLSESVGSLGMWVFLLSLASFFVAGLVAVVVLALTSTQWPGRDELSLPPVLWLSNLLIVVSSYTLHLALRAIRADQPRSLTRYLLLTIAGAFAFLFTQGWSWFALVEANQRIDSNLFYWMFYVLSALHAVHLLGGLVPLVMCTLRALGGRYSAEEHRGVRFTAMYWHFLGGVWLAMFVTLFALT